MKQYTKPVIAVDNGLSEGVYAASGSSAIPVTLLRYDGDWGNGGTAVFTVDLSGMNPAQLTVMLTFNMNIAGGWGGGASSSISGKNVTLSWYSAPSSAEISIQVQGADVKQLTCTGFSYANK